MVATYSGLQREVMALYRRALRMTQATSITPRQVSAIEHLLRKGRRQLEMYEDPKVRDCWVSKEMREWDEGDRRRAVNAQ